MSALGIVVFALALLLSVVIHEGGHFLTAKAFGMKATQFFVGFGPTLFSRRRGETEYGVKAIPAGGFVKIVGMTPLEEVAPEDQKRAFYRQPAPQRVIVLAAGSFTHLVIAVLLVLGIAFFTPQDRPGPHAQVGSVAACVPLVATPGPVRTDGGCGSGAVTSPASLAGLRSDDLLLALDGVPVTSYDDLTKAIRGHRGPQATLRVERAGVARDVPVTLVPVKRNLVTGGPGTDDAFALGIAGGQQVTYASPTWDQAWSRVARLLGTGDQSIVAGTFRGFYHLPSSLSHLFSSDRNTSVETATPQSVVGIAQATGDLLAHQGQPLSVRVGNVVYVIAAVNFFIGILNLLPLLPFDGGHIAVTLAERATRRRRRDNAEVGSRIAAVYNRSAPAMYVVFFAFVAMSLVVLYADVANPSRF